MQTTKVQYSTESNSKVICGLWVLSSLVNVILLVVLGHTKYSDRSLLYSTGLFLASGLYAETALLEWVQMLKTRRSSINRRRPGDYYMMFQAAVASIAAIVVFAVFCVTLVKRQVNANLLLVKRSIWYTSFTDMHSGYPYWDVNSTFAARSIQGVLESHYIRW
jgi:hypothetical protein